MKKLNKELIADIVAQGASGVKKAFEIFVGQGVEVIVPEAKQMDTTEVLKSIANGVKAENSLVAYSQGMESPEGIVMLVIERETALRLVDLLSGEPVGTAGLLENYEVSAILETLNVVSNAFLTAIADGIGEKMIFGVPKIVTAEKISQLDNFHCSDCDNLVFEMKFKIGDYELPAKFYTLFTEELSNFLD